ncbi:hypothetical protein LTR36_005115 [Oleoguttula mirabilis]|uniref:Uncharacterized protein n=1 Tax=Oleoguttula mirabilis TaxID=1507867 RepID=A0AAV9JWA1_9PEZI|nr:hypothetical protein LTR36_005115 [Oleoguttula mirabilis]
MAMSQAEKSAPRNKSLCLIIAYTEEHLGEWKDKAAQDQAFAAFLERKPLYYIPSQKSTREAFDVPNLRKAISQAIQAHRTPGPKGIAAFFSSGVAIFDERWLSEIGWKPKAAADQTSLNIDLRPRAERKRPASVQESASPPSFEELSSVPEHKKRKFALQKKGTDTNTNDEGASGETLHARAETVAEPYGTAATESSNSNQQIPGATKQSRPASSSLGESSRRDISRVPEQVSAPIQISDDEATVASSNQSDGRATVQHVSGAAKQSEGARLSADRSNKRADGRMAGPQAETEGTCMQQKTIPDGWSGKRQHAQGTAGQCDVAEPGADDLSKRANGQAIEVQAGINQTVVPQQKRAANGGSDVRTPPRKGRSELIMDVGGDRKERAIGGILKSVLIAVELYLKQYGVEGRAPADFDQGAKHELEALYATFFGTKDWKGRLVQLADREHPFTLDVRDVLVGLLGASVYQDILSKNLPWSISAQLQEALGPDIKYLQKMFDADGSNLKHASYYQIYDEDFQQTTVAEHARVLAKNLVLTLMPHFSRLEREQGVYNPQPWLRQIESAFAQAIVLRQQMDCSEFATYKAVWFAGDEMFDPAMHNTNSTDGRPATVIVTLLPGIHTTTVEGASYFIANAEVVAHAHASASQN